MKPMESIFWKNPYKIQLREDDRSKITLYLHPDILTNVDIIAARENKSRSFVLATIITEWLCMYETEHLEEN